MADPGYGTEADSGTIEDLGRGAVADSKTLEDLGRGARGRLWNSGAGGGRPPGQIKGAWWS